MSNKILIVEDEFIMANALRLLLRQAGYRVCGIASSAEEACESLQKDKPDLVLLDIRLKGKLSGIDLARKLKAEHIAFIYLSANSSQAILEEAKQTEPYGFLVKPFREKDLLVALDIASYRHKNSLESRLRQEAALQKALWDISKETSEARQKLLKTGRAIRSFIPFDLIVAETTPANTKTSEDFGYLRIGFDEYQFIGEKELLTIAGVKADALPANTGKSLTGTQPVIITNNTGEGQPADARRQIWFDAFRAESCLAFPVVTGNGTSVHYYFYSRQRDAYTQSHMAVLSLFTSCLTNVTESMTGPAAIPAPLPEARQTVPSGRSNAGFTDIIGNHPLLLAALDLVTQVAPYNTSVLILGESGTGKEKVAHAIHTHSPRKNGPYIKVNCAAIPAALIESELFGHEKGAFTGAVEKRKGKFEQADGGTIFLDEIGELPLDMQVRLLRVLQEKEIENIGGNVLRKIDVRIVAATNRNLEKEVAEGNFRLDLYYRLNVFPITLPPLRERKSDIILLAEYFTRKFCEEFAKEYAGLSETMVREMHAYGWPGNIRELENVIQRAVILNNGRSALELKQTLPGAPAEPYAEAKIETLGDVKRLQENTERDYIISILRKTKGLIRGLNGAAELLNIKPTTLESKMARLGIQRKDFTSSGGDV
ncbi:sigma 54-interacting response regulator [Dyadobacter beijingensis]|nr:sigma 54-interacting response regulator [Dyadobacter beijingensis]